MSIKLYFTFYLTVCTRSPLLEWHIVLIILGTFFLVAGIVLTIFLAVIAVCYSKFTKNGYVGNCIQSGINQLLRHVKMICAEMAYQVLVKGFHSQVQQPPCAETHSHNPNPDLHNINVHC